jgi:hypothetical protein
MADTGNGGTLTLSSTGSVGSVRSLNLGEHSLPSIDSSHLGTTNWISSIPGDLADPGEVQIEAIFDQDTAGIPSLGTVEDITITFPIVNAANGTNATYTASGFLTNASLPELVNNELMMMTLTFKLDGVGTEPTFTAEAT